MTLFRLSILLLLSMLSTACSVEVPDPEEMIRDRIEEGRRYAVDRELDKLVAMVTDDFIATRGIDRKSLKTWLARFYLSGQSTQVFVRIRQIDADWETAIATILMGTTNLSLKDLNFDNLRGRLLHMKLHFEFVDDDVWKVNRVDWRDARPEDLTVF